MSPAQPPTNATRRERGGPEYPIGTPLTSPRRCSACRQMHPVGTTCAGGAFPWLEEDSTMPSPVTPVIITLTPDELAQGIACGKHRFATKEGKDRMGRDDESSHVVGATGERAFARWLNEHGLRMPWRCSNHEYHGAADFAGCQVRAQRQRAAHHGTKVKKDDPLSIPVVSFVELDPGGARYLFRGWMIARNARRPEWWKDPGNRGKPNWFAPDSALLPPDTLLDSDEFRRRNNIRPKALDDE